MISSVQQPEVMVIRETAELKRWRAVCCTDLLSRIKANDARMKGISYGTYGVCVACYNLAPITEHHIAPRSVHQKSRDWKPFKVMICRKCHAIVHKLATNDNLYMKHKTLADVIMDIRTASLNVTRPLETEGRTAIKRIAVAGEAVRLNNR